MRNGISVTVLAADGRRLCALVRDRNAAQKHVWRARIVLLTVEGLGTNKIICRTVEETNEMPKPFTWTANPDKIIAAVKRGHQVLDSIH